MYLNQNSDNSQAEIKAPDEVPLGLSGYYFSDIGLTDSVSNRYLVKGIINWGEIATLFGSSGTMKSFVALDLAFHLSTGLEWRGRHVDKTGVLILLGEGTGGYRTRILALKRKYKVLDAPIAVIEEPLSLMSDGDLLRKLIEAAEYNMFTKIGLVIVDTFSLMLGDGDESNNSHVSLALNNLRKALKGRSAVLVHHSGNNNTDRERGAYQIQANCDVRIKISRNNSGYGDVLTLTSKKNKDGALFEPIYLSYETVVIATNEDRDDITSLVIVGTEKRPQIDHAELAGDHETGKKLSKPMQYFLKAKEMCGTDDPELHKKKFFEIYPANTNAATHSAFYTAKLDYEGRAVGS